MSESLNGSVVNRVGAGPKGPGFDPLSPLPSILFFSRRLLGFIFCLIIFLILCNLGRLQLINFHMVNDDRKQEKEERVCNMHHSVTRY